MDLNFTFYMNDEIRQVLGAWIIARFIKFIIEFFRG